MTVAVDEIIKVIRSGDGVTTTFSFPFTIYESTDLQVTHVDVDGVETPVSEGVGAADCIVNVTSYPGTGNITYPASGTDILAVGEKLVLKSVLPVKQALRLNNQGGYLPHLQEIQFDKIVRIILQKEEELDRALKVPLSDESGADYTFPAPEALKLFRWNAAGLALEAITALAAGLVVAGSATPEDVSLTAAAVGVADDYAREDHVHLLPTVSVAKGGTGGVTAPVARVNLEVDRPVQTKTATYAQVATDINNMIRWTSAGSYTLLAAATAGDDFQVDIMADGAAVTIDPDGAELVNGAATVTVAAGTSGTLFCDGTAWYFLAGGGGGGSFRGENGNVAASNVGDIFRVHEQELNTDVTIAAAENAICAGPLTVASAVTLTVASGGTLVVA